MKKKFYMNINNDIKLLSKILLKQRKIYLFALFLMVLYSSTAYVLPVLMQKIYDSLIEHSSFKCIIYIEI
jgi:ABC-type bacteriocin/lantibiotic exporter with double-glycine peptidase domain